MNKNNSIQNISIKKNSLETIDKVVLSEQTKFQLSEIIGIENYFYQEINQKESCSKKLNKYVTNKILMLAKSKLNSIEALISQALIDLDISHEEFIRILKEKDKYEKMKENLRSENEEYKIMRLSGIKSKT